MGPYRGAPGPGTRLLREIFCKRSLSDSEKELGGLVDCEVQCTKVCEGVKDFEGYNDCMNECIRECAEALEKPMKR